MAVYALGDRVPNIDPTAFVHPDAVVIGHVTLGAHASVWPSAVLRGDYGVITVGARTSIQDGTIIHATATKPTTVGADCVIGHNAHLVGSGSIVLHDVVVHSGALVGAGALVPNGMDVPSFAMALGVPAKLRENAVQPGAFEEGVALYVANATRYQSELRRID